MLDAEEARARLEATVDAGWADDARSRIDGEPDDEVRATAAVFLEPIYISDREERDRHEAARAAAGAFLDAARPETVARVTTLLHPEVGADLAALWTAAVGHPYPTGWTRRSFRAPHHPETSRPRRLLNLHALVHGLGPHRRATADVAAWVGHIGRGGTGYRGLSGWQAGPLLAAAIDREAALGRRDVLDTLLAMAHGEHPVGRMGTEVVRGLLGSGRAEAWEAVERLLLAAQRQEGLRQVILESADEAQPAAFDRLLDLVLDEGLLRFAAAVRAGGVWIGFWSDAGAPEGLERHLRRLRQLRADADAARAATGADEPWDVYLSLFALAMADVHEALPLAEQVMTGSPPPARAAAVATLAQLALPAATDALLAALDDADLEVAATAAAAIDWSALANRGHPTAFESVERLLGRLPAKARTEPPAGVRQTPLVLDRAPLAMALLRVRGDRPVARVLPWRRALDPLGRQALLREIARTGEHDAEVRGALVTLVGDRSPDVRNAAVHVLSDLVLAPEEAPAIEALLTRRAGDLRWGAIALLAGLAPPERAASARRLWAAGAEGQRDAAAELLAAEVPAPPEVAAVVAELLADGPSDRQREALAPVAHGTADAPVGPGLGLFDPARLSPPTPPRTPAGRVFATDAARRLVGALDDLAHAHRDTPVICPDGTERLLGDLRHLPHPAFASRAGGDPDEGLVLADVVRRWWDGRPSGRRDGDDGLDALRAYAVLRSSGAGLSPGDRGGAMEWLLPCWRDAVGGAAGELRHPGFVAHVLQWSIVAHAHPAIVDECLDALDATLAAVPEDQVALLGRDDLSWHDDWRGDHGRHHPWSEVLGWLTRRRPDLFDGDRLRRWLGLRRWMDEPTAGASRSRPPTELVVAAHRLGVATDDDVYDALLHDHRMLPDLTRRRRQPAIDAFPAGVALADRLRDRIVEVERQRGDVATEASRHALRLSSVQGADLALDLLHRLGRTALVRGRDRHESRGAVLSHLIRVSYPGPDDTPVSIAATAAALGLADERLVDLAVYAPQWSALVERALGWDGLAEAVWWYHAHTKDERWAVDREVRETWAVLSAERTPLGAEDLLDGAVDVDWFRRARATLGPERWDVVHGAAKLASGGNGHARAKLFADALVGALDPAVLDQRLAKRTQDAMRALGLVPLPADPVAAGTEALGRYQRLRELERGARRFGPQRRASERAAVRIGIENLARTAGHTDPQRFVWAMEAAEAGDLADGPVAATEGDVTVTLSVDDEGVPQLAVDRAGTALAAVPAALRTAPALAELRDRKTALDRQAGRVRASLEAAMVGRTPFADQDLAALGRHPLVAPMLALLVFVDERGRTLRWRDGRWRDVEGSAVRPKGVRRLAHPVDLVTADWPAWQEQLFLDGRRQPVRQVFRELYVLTDAERDEGHLSRRWEGHQVQTGPAVGLFGSRGWLVDREAGEVVRAFHADDVVARVGFLPGWGTPAEVELPTVGTVGFTRRGSSDPLPLDVVPAIVFSEAMRDLDLVVSVAHAGGVDPEASASTVEMRAALVRETARLLGLANVRAEGERHVVVEGALGEYSIHLGSGTVHRRPGGALCIIPVDSQRRGRLFLPFADDDPKTAEVVAKVLLLARDRDIRDPTILDQLRS